MSRQIVSDLGAGRADLTEAQFSYRSCGFNGKPPFQGTAHIALWMPGADRSHPVTAESVVARLRQHGWDIDPDFHTHAMAFKRDGLNVKVYVIPPLNSDQHPVGHVMIDVLTECKDTFDHRTDRTAYTSTDITGELAR